MLDYVYVYALLRGHLKLLGMAIGGNDNDYEPPRRILVPISKA